MIPEIGGRPTFPDEFAREYSSFPEAKFRMIPGEIFPTMGGIRSGGDRAAIALKVSNSGDRPIQVMKSLPFRRNQRRARIRSTGCGGCHGHSRRHCIRFEPGQTREVSHPIRWYASGFHGFHKAVMGPLPKGTRRGDRRCHKMNRAAYAADVWPNGWRQSASRTPKSSSK